MRSRPVFQTLQLLFQGHRWPILLTYGLTFLENLFELLYPLVIGLAIDGLLKQQFSNLVLLGGIWVIHAIIEVFRHVYDTRTFTQVYSNLAVSVVIVQVKQGISASLIVARSALSREFADFFERDVPQIISALFGFVGALAMLFFYDVQLSLYCLLLLVPVIALNYAYLHKSQRLNQKLNDQLEYEVEILSKCQPDEVKEHYQQLAKWRIYLSNAEAVTWGLMEVFVIVLFIAALIRTVTIPGVQPGEIYAIISYVWSYRQSFDKIPAIVQQLSRLHDIADRITESTLPL
jgi:ABC-type multidrug transport system fused ATPase/permease subunit